MLVHRATIPGPLAGHRIVVDPGHGGDDPGAIGPSGLREKDVNLAVSLHLRDRLEELGADVLMTRETDRSVAPPGSSTREELQARVDIANNWPAEVFISVHSNSWIRPDKRGTEAYHAREASPESIRLARLIHQEMVRRLNLPDGGVRAANFYVIRHTHMPAQLTEIAYISNPVEEPLLADPQFQKEVAVAIASGVARYFEGAQAPDEPAGNPEEFLVAT